MRIKFLAPDPRAGDIAQMDSKRGQQLIDEGAAVRITEDGSDLVPAAVSGRTALAIALAAGLDAALAELPGDYTEPEFVVAGMRRHFGALFTAEDEATARAAFPAEPAGADAAAPAAPQDGQPAAPDAPASDGAPAPGESAADGDTAVTDDAASAAKATTAKPKTPTSKK